MVIAGRINVDLTASLRRAGARTVGLSGIDAGLITAVRRPPVTVRENGEERTVDFGNVGDVREVNPDVLEHLLAGGYTPVIACLGASADGAPLNINADVLAETLASALKAKKLIFMTDQPGVLRDIKDRTTLLPFADLNDLQGLLDSGAIAGGMKLKVEACLRAATNGVKRTHIIDGTAKDSLLLEVFTGEGCGTMIVGEREKQIYQEKELV
jgi:acetylglutamate kinase